MVEAERVADGNNLLPNLKVHALLVTTNWHEGSGGRLDFEDGNVFAWLSPNNRCGKCPLIMKSDRKMLRASYDVEIRHYVTQFIPDEARARSRRHVVLTPRPIVHHNLVLCHVDTGSGHASKHRNRVSLVFGASCR